MITCLICDHNDAGHRYACDDDIAKIQKQLREIGTYWDLLSRFPTFREPTRNATGRGAPGYTSRPPARLDVIATLDIRSTGDILGPDDIEQPIVSIRAAIRHIATWVNEVTGLSGSGYGYLLGSVQRVAMTRSIERLAAEVSHLHRQLRALAHDAPPRPLGTCLGVDCGGNVYQTWRDQVEGARCSRCLRTYTGLDLVRLSVAQEAS